MAADNNIRRAFTPRETQHSMKRRAPWHDYSSPGTYMLTIAIEGRRPLLGRLVIGDANGDGARVELSPLGMAIGSDVVRKMAEVYPQIEVWRLCIMPDHIHMIVRVKEPLPEGKHLGHVVAGFKRGCHRAAKQLGETIAENGTQPPVPCDYFAGHPSLFETGYNDRLLFDGIQLDRWKHYLNDNPRRLAIKRLHPNLFTIKRGMRIADRECQTVGNQFLLDIPDKVAVIVHGRYSDSEYRKLTELWLACGERGGVLVSAAISPKEKAVLTEARERGYRIIWLNENGFPAYYKPTGKAFDACTAGLLLQVSPWEYHTENRDITRRQCLELNAMAIAIAGAETEL